MTYSLDEENREVVFLVQACLSELSQNFHYMALKIGDPLLLMFALESENERDREAIEDIWADFYAMHDNDPAIEVEVTIGPEHHMPPQEARLIWVRRDDIGLDTQAGLSD